MRFDVYDYPRLLVCVALAAGLLSSCGFDRQRDTSQTQEAWNDLNDPALMFVASRDFFGAPTEGGVEQNKLWNGYYWPTMRGGIAQRWQTPVNSADYQDYLYAPITSAQLAALSSSELNQLSPTEKWDIYLGRNDFPLTRWEQARVRSQAQSDGTIPGWFGLCHGWAAASVEEKAPLKAVDVLTPSGQTLRFEPQDLEALLTGLYGDLYSYRSVLLGARCNDDDPGTDDQGRYVDERCRDANPGAFHLVVTDYLGRQKKSFIADFATLDQVWNYPVASYKFNHGGLRRVTADDRARGHLAPDATYLVDVTMQLASATGAGLSHTPGAPLTKQLHRFSYTLELDQDKKIVGGEWITQDRPDFLWVPVSKPQDAARGLLAYDDVSQLVALANAPSRTPDPTPTPTPSPTPSPAPTPRPGVPVITDTSPHGIAVLQLVNGRTADNLISLGVTPEAAYRVRVYYLGRDGYAPSPDDQPIRTIGHLRQMMGEADIALLARYAEAQGLVRQ